MPVPAGTPAWVDLQSADVDAAKDFYSRLFGWEVDTIPAPEAGGYALFRHGGKMVAGVGPQMGEAQGAPASWMTYVYVDDVDATAARIRAAGGQVFVEPFDVMDQGRMCVAADPTGGVVGVWEPKQHEGAELFNEPVSLTWNELWTSDRSKAREFYGAAFGWEPQPMDEFPYDVMNVDGRPIAGVAQREEGDDRPTNWLAYFSVADCDDVVGRAQEAGAECLREPRDSPYGRSAVLRDPQGAVFAVNRAAQS